MADVLTKNIEELQKNTGKNIVFIETDMKIDSATHFLQYIFNGKRLLTLFGEDHLKPFECEKPSTTIAEYCLFAVKNNPKCSVMLEFNQYESLPCDFKNCKVLFETFTSLKGKESQIIPFDIRPVILTREVQDLIYIPIEGDGLRYFLNYAWSQPEKQKGGYPETNLIMYVKPFYDFFKIKMGDAKDPDPSIDEPLDKFLQKDRLHEPISDYLIEYYKTEMVEFFNSIRRKIINNDPAREIQEELMRAWAHVADFFVLKILLDKETLELEDEYILIIGEAHLENIQSSLQIISSKIIKSGGRPFIFELTKQTGQNDQCTNLYHSYKF